MLTYTDMTGGLNLCLENMLLLLTVLWDIKMSQISHYGNESNQRCEIKDMFSRILRHKGKGGLPSGRRSFLDFFYSFESCSTLPGIPNFLTWKIFIRFLHTHNFKGKARLNHL